MKIQDASFAENFSDKFKFSPDEIREFARDKAKILIVRMKNGSVCSFVMAEPYKSAFEQLIPYDKAMEAPCDGDFKYYVSILVVPYFRRRNMDYFILVRALVEELVAKRGIRKLTMHAKTGNRYSNRILKFSRSSQVKRTVHNFMGCGEPFDFIEMNISDEDIVRFDKTFLSRTNK